MTMSQSAGIRCVVFDWDGTLVNTLPSIYNALLDTCAELGGLMFSYETFLYEFDIPPRPFHETCKIDTSLYSAEAIHEIYQKHLKLPTGPDALLPGALATIRTLHQRGIQLAMVTGNTLSHVKSVLHPDDFALFDSDLIFPETLHKEEALRAIKAQTVPGDGPASDEAILFLDDIPGSIRHAVNARVTPVGIIGIDCPKRKAKLVSAGAPENFCITSVANLLDLIDQIHFEKRNLCALP